jgi:BRCA1-associated protein
MDSSRIRKRSVLFGNPALGTYVGDVVTLETSGETAECAAALNEEGEEMMESMVAMVDVPPEQVPEGILNLARSHLPWIVHVRIVIAVSDTEEEDESNKTYLVLFQMTTPAAADAFCHDLDGRPYTFLDETVTCTVHPVVALKGHDGVSLLNPMFAPKQTNKTSTTTSNNTQEDFNCAVCLEHMNSKELQNQTSTVGIFTTVCNHTFHLDCILQCQDSPCPVCRYDHSGLNEALSQCHICATTEHNYVCLICGVVSCVATEDHHTNLDARDSTVNSSNSKASLPHSLTSSQPSRHPGVAASSSSFHPNSNDATARHFYTSHAGQHHDETLHAYALDTQTQHVWDFAGQGYVHRLLQNKQDGKLVEVSDPYSTASLERTMSPGLSDTQEGEVVHRKLEGFASQYYTLLKSQLEQQRIFYEGRLQELRQEFGIEPKKNKAQKSESLHLTALKQERRQLQQRLLSIQKKYTKVKEDVKFLKSMNESLEANKPQLEQKIKQAQQERMESREMTQKYLPALEEKVTTLMLQLEEQCNNNYMAQECAPEN